MTGSSYLIECLKDKSNKFFNNNKKLAKLNNTKNR